MYICMYICCLFYVLLWLLSPLEGALGMDAFFLLLFDVWQHSRWPNKQINSSNFICIYLWIKCTLLTLLYVPSVVQKVLGVAHFHEERIVKITSYG